MNGEQQGVYVLETLMVTQLQPKPRVVEGEALGLLKLCNEYLYSGMHQVVFKTDCKVLLGKLQQNELDISKYTTKKQAYNITQLTLVYMKTDVNKCEVAFL